MTDADVARFILYLDATAPYAVRRLIEIANDPNALSDVKDRAQQVISARTIP
jgi:hypothetical protein